MKINGRHYRTIWLGADGWSVEVIEQTRLPHRFETIALKTVGEAAHAIKSMQVRGAPLIGATAAYGLALALRADASDASLAHNIAYLNEQRPTAVNLRWSLEEMRRVLAPLPPAERIKAAYGKAAALCDDDVETCRRIGVHGLPLIEAIAAKKKPGVAVNILRIATPAGSPASTGAPRHRRSIRRTTKASKSTFGSMKRARAIRAPRSRPSSLAGTVYRTPSSSITPAAT